MSINKLSILKFYIAVFKIIPAEMFGFDLGHRAMSYHKYKQDRRQSFGKD